MDRIRFEYRSAMVTDVRIAVGTPDTRSKLITEGKLVTYGIYFDVNKDVVKPESYGTLKDIAAVPTENPGVRVKITGHTNSDVADAVKIVNNWIAPNDTPANKALNSRIDFINFNR